MKRTAIHISCSGLTPHPLKKSKDMKGNSKGQGDHQFPKISKKKNLTVTELRGRDIIEVEGVLTILESERFIDAAENLDFLPTKTRGPAYGEAYRDNSRVSINSAQLADSLWQSGIQEIFRDYRVDGRPASGLNSNIRFYKYAKGNKFGKHVDESVKIGSKETKYTLLVYLSGGHDKGDKDSTVAPRATAPLRGGETLFYGGKRSRLVASVTPRPGLALLHLHGDDCLEHEAAEVKSGVKYILRSDVLF